MSPTINEVVDDRSGGTAPAAAEARGDELADLRQVLQSVEDEGLRRRALGELARAERKLAGRPAVAAGGDDLPQQDHYRFFMDFATDGMILHDRDGRILDVNLKACESLGYTREELIGATPVVFDPDVDEGILAGLSNRLDTGEEITFESRHRRRDGTVFPVEVRLRPFWADGERLSLSMALDITARKQAEEALRVQERRLRLALEASKTGVWEWSLRTATVYWSPECYRIIGVDDLGETLEAFTRMVHPDDVEDLVARSRRAVKEGGEGTAEFRVVLPDGGIKWLSTCSVLQHFGKGDLLKLVGTVRDVTEEKQAAEALRASETRYRVFVDHAADGLFLLDLEGSIVDVNRQACESLGREREELVGRTMREFDPDVTPALLRERRQRLSAGETLAFEAHHRRRDGSLFPVEVRVRPFSIDGAPFRLALARDISVRKQAEETLRQIIEVTAPTTGHDFFRTLTDHLSRVCEVDYVFLAEIDPEAPERARTRAVSYRGRAVEGFTYELSDTPCENVAGKRLCHYPTGVQERFPEDRMLAEMGIDSYLGTPLFSGRGEALGLIVLLHGRPIPRPDTARAILQIVAARAGAELERDRAEAALRASEARLRTLLENLDNVAVQAYEADGTITFWNAASERLYGYSAADAVGRDLVELLHGEEASARERRIMAEALVTGEVPAAEEQSVTREDGSRITVLSCRMLHPRPGKRPEFFCFDVDITDRKLAEEELAARQAELLHASRLATVGQMVAALSHEVAQPLSAIGNFAAAAGCLLDDGPAARAETLREYLRGIESQNQRCGAILQRLRDFLRHTVPRKAICDLNSILLDSLSLLESDFRRHGVSVRREGGEQTLLLVADRVQVQQAIVNLLTNARAAMAGVEAGRREVTVRTFAREGEAVLEVEDRGHGLLSEVRDRLFEPFVTTKEEGMGIGLSICKTIVSSHGGSIEAEEAAAGGARFRARFPLRRGEWNE